jgi:hypothetical protein
MAATSTHWPPLPPPDLKTRLLEAFDIQVLWNKPGRQATVHAEITDATLRALPAILDPGQDGYDDTSEQQSCELAAVEDLFETPMVHETHPGARIHPDCHGVVRLTVHVRSKRHRHHDSGRLGRASY